METIKLKKLYNSSCMQVSCDRVGISQDIPIYEEILGISICLFSCQASNQRIYNGNPRFADKFFLYHYENEFGGHFDVLTKQNQLMCTPYFCNDCGKGFKTATQHCCRKWCNVCARECVKKEEIVCEFCHRKCRSIECYNAHRKTKILDRGPQKGKETVSLCDKFWQCPSCGITLQKNNRNPEQHVCGEVKCNICHEYFLNEDHKCYMRAVYSEKEVSKFIFYDFECYQKDNVHIPNYVVAMSVCNLCENEPISENSTCLNCGSRCFICNKFNKSENQYERLPCMGCGK